MMGTEFHYGLCPEDKLLDLLRDTSQRLPEVLSLERTTGARLENDDSARVLKKLFWLFKEWSVLHIHRVGFLREELDTTAHALTELKKKSNSACTHLQEGTKAPTQMGISRGSYLHKHAYMTDVIINMLEDLRNIEKKLCSVTGKLDRAICILSEAKQEHIEANEEAQKKDIVIPTNITMTHDNLVLLKTSSEDSCVPQETYEDYTSYISQSDPSVESTEAESSSICKEKNESLSSSVDSGNESLVKPGTEGTEDAQCEVVKSLSNDDQEPHQKHNEEQKKEFAEGPGKKTENEEGRQFIQSERDCVSWTQNWDTVGLTDSASSSSNAVCYVTGPKEVTKVISCKVVDGLSSLVVSGSEELLSSVIRIEKPNSTKYPFPLTVAVPFRAYYRGIYREITVKVVDQEQKFSYITPVATEGHYGGHRDSFAVVRVYTLGIFAVVSHLQKETFTIPKRGLSVKLSVDSRICLDYLPGSFTTPVIAQAMVQPVDAMMLSTLKCRNDSYHSILTSSPLLYLIHPSTLTLQRPFTITLPCPPNPDKKKTGEDTSHLTYSNIALMSNTFSPHRIRILSASLKSTRELCKEQLAVLGWRDKQWNLLHKVSARNLQNGLVSFELLENYERLIVLRLLSSVRPFHLVFFAEELEEAVRTCAVTVVLQTRQQDHSSAVLTVLPSRELKFGLAELQAQNYCGPQESFPEISMREGEQLLLKFNGNITSTGDHDTAHHTITFHSQRKNRLSLKLKEVDPFGNYSSHHYKGTAMLFRIPREQLVWRGDRAVISEDYSLEEAVCKLSLSLPKTVKTLSRPTSTKALRHDQTDPLCDELLVWLCGELSEEDAALLVTCFRLRRSTVQLARLRAPDSFSLQTFHILAAWRRALPSSTPKYPLLARCLTRIGRADLAAELLRRGPAVEKGKWRGAEPWRLTHWREL